MTVTVRSLRDQPSALPANSYAYQEADITSMTPQTITTLAQNILSTKEHYTIYIPVDPFFRKIKEISDTTLLNSLLLKLRESHLSPSKPEGYPGVVTAHTKEGHQVSCSKDFIKVAPVEFSNVISTLSTAAAMILIDYLSEKKQPETLTKEIFLELSLCPYAVQQGAVGHLLEKFPCKEFSDEEKVYIWAKIKDFLSSDSQGTVLKGWYPLNDDDNYVKIITTFVDTTDYNLGYKITEMYLCEKKIGSLDKKGQCLCMTYESFTNVFRGEPSPLKDLLIQFIHVLDIGPISTSAFPLHAVCEKYRAQVPQIVIRSLKDGPIPSCSIFGFGGSLENNMCYSSFNRRTDLFCELLDGIKTVVADGIRAISELLPNAEVVVHIQGSTNIEFFTIPSMQSKNEEQEIARLRKQNSQVAKTGYQAVIEKNPKSIATLYLAAILVQEGALDEAEPYLKTALINSSGKERALASNYAALYHLKKIGLQISLSSLQIQKIEKLVKSDSSYAYNVCMGAVHFYKGEYVQARALLTKAHSILPTDECRKLLGATYYYLQKPDEAHSYFSQVKVSDFFTNRYFGAVLYQRHAYDKAKERLLRAVNESPNDQFSQMHLGASCFHLGDYNKALAWLLTSPVTHVMVKCYLGAIYYHGGDLQRAKQYLQEAYASNPNDAIFCLPYLGVVTFELKEYDEAEKHLQQALPASYFQKLSRQPQTLGSLYKQVRGKLPGSDPNTIEAVIKEFGAMTLK